MKSLIVFGLLLTTLLTTHAQARTCVGVMKRHLTKEQGGKISAYPINFEMKVQNGAAVVKTSKGTITGAFVNDTLKSRVPGQNWDLKLAEVKSETEGLFMIDTEIKDYTADLKLYSVSNGTLSCK